MTLDPAPLSLAVVAGTTRPQRKSVGVAEWVRAQAAARGDAEVELVDLADAGLPLLDEPSPAVWGRYDRPHSRSWSDTVAGFDAFVLVTAEYNRSIPGALKNALDFLYAEWHNKAVGFVSYGADAGGARAVEHLRTVVAELQMADVGAHVACSLGEDFASDGRFTPRPGRERQLEKLLDQLIPWAAAMRSVRDQLTAA